MFIRAQKSQDDNPILTGSTTQETTTAADKPRSIISMETTIAQFDYKKFSHGFFLTVNKSHDRTLMAANVFGYLRDVFPRELLRNEEELQNSNAPINKFIVNVINRMPTITERDVVKRANLEAALRAYTIGYLRGTLDNADVMEGVYWVTFRRIYASLRS